MNIKTLHARWIANRTEARTRLRRRSLRDYQRIESAAIHEMEKNARGLRLYIAWSQPRQANVVHTTVSDWKPALQQAA